MNGCVCMRVCVCLDPITRRISELLHFLDDNPVRCRCSALFYHSLSVNFTQLNPGPHCHPRHLSFSYPPLDPPLSLTPIHPPPALPTSKSVYLSRFPAVDFNVFSVSPARLPHPPIPPPTLISALAQSALPFCSPLQTHTHTLTCAHAHKDPKYTLFSQ